MSPVCRCLALQFDNPSGEVAIKMAKKPPSHVMADTSVMVDIVLTSRPRHADGDKLRAYLKANNLRLRFPMHGMFELGAALHNEKIGAKGAKLPFNQNMPEASPLEADPIAVDQAFFAKYFDPGLPYLKGGDLIFVAMAKKDGAVLITEDTKQYDAAKAAGVEVYRIAAFLKAYT